MDRGSILQQIYLTQKKCEVEQPENVQRSRWSNQLSPFTAGMILGLLVGGIALATILTVFIRDNGKNFRNIHMNQR